MKHSHYRAFIFQSTRHGGILVWTSIVHSVFHDWIRPLRSGAWRFYREPPGSDLAEKRTWQIPLRHNSHQTDRKSMCNDGNVERYNGRI